MTKAMTKSLFIVSNNELFEGASLSLPVENQDGSWTPGNWHNHKEFANSRLTSTVARAGIRVTNEPVSKWHSQNASCYEVECADLLSDCHRGFLYANVRLLRKLSNQELVVHNILKSGIHNIQDQEVVIVGTAQVTLTGKSKAHVWSAKCINAHDYTQIFVERGSSQFTVNAYEQSVVTTNQACLITANDNSKVEIQTVGRFKILTPQSRLPKGAGKLPRINTFNNASIRAAGNSIVKLKQQAAVNVNFSYPED